MHHESWIFGPNIGSYNGADIEPNIEPNIKPKIEPNIEPNYDPNKEPNIKPNIDPNMEPNIETNIEPNIKPTRIFNQTRTSFYIPQIYAQLPWICITTQENTTHTCFDTLGIMF